MKWTIVRILLGIFSPGLIGLLLLTAYSFLFSSDQNTNTFNLHSFFELLLFSYLFVGIQSILYSILMEYLINRRIDDHTLVVAYSACHGTLSALPFYVSPEIIYIGFITGLIAGVLLRYLYILTTEMDIEKDTAMENNEWLHQMLEEQRAKEAERFRFEKEKAEHSGKEPFDFEKLCSLYDPRSDLAPADQPITNEMRDRYEMKYYVDYADCISIEEFVARMVQVDLLPNR